MTDDARARLVDVPFGADRKVSIEASQLLFELDAAQAALFNSNSDEPVELRLIVGAHAASIEKNLGNKPRLVRYKRSNRYGGRDEAQGGDDWVRPTVRPCSVASPSRFRHSTTVTSAI